MLDLFSIPFGGAAFPHRCKVMDMRLGELAPRHLESKFLRIDAEKTPFFVQKLQVEPSSSGGYFFIFPRDPCERESPISPSPSPPWRVRRVCSRPKRTGSTLSPMQVFRSFAGECHLLRCALVEVLLFLRTGKESTGADSQNYNAGPPLPRRHTTRARPTFCGGCLPHPPVIS